LCWRTSRASHTGDVLERDRNCVYCGIEFDLQSTERRLRPSWEHIINDARIISLENIARCCVGCNASKGAKELLVWMGSNYCKKKGIAVTSVAPVVQAAITTALARRQT